MVLTDTWTVVNAIILALEIVGIGFVFRRGKKEDTQHDDTNNTALNPGGAGR